jgi:TetR/AcrR family transcriptional regulator, regulator of cefoperazone and chloramphenicol sensitivity
MTERDGETRGRLLAAATRLFAARGFRKVTVREICREAGANVAAVNYHFGDKLGLYRDVLGTAIETMRGTTDAARDAGQGRTPEERLRTYIRVFLQRAVGRGHDSWIHQLMAQEMADPTPALDVVTDQVIRPRLAYVGEIVAELLERPSDDERVRWCVLSVQAQCHAAMTNPISRRLLPDVHVDGAEVDRLADHIADFSLGGIRSLRSA